MFKYFHIIKFLMTHDLTELKEYWQSEILRNTKFNWTKLIRRYFKEDRLSYKYLVWWRMASQMQQKGNKNQIKASNKLQLKLISKFNIEIGLRARIGKNFFIDHCTGIVITNAAIIGNNCNIRQNTTIGVKTLPKFAGAQWPDINYSIEIGNNVFIGANCCILADNLKIGDNVTIGAMSFINKDIPNNYVVYTEKTTKIIQKLIN